MNVMIELCNVTKKYQDVLGNEKYALKEINLTIQPGEFIGIAGRNGSGKTTLARLLNGLILPSEGQVLVNGMDTKEYKHKKDIRRLVGMVFQNPDNQIINPIVEEEIAFGLGNIGLPPSEVEPRITWALQVVGLTELRYHAPHLLSGGQKQRLAIAAALAMHPSYLVLDEPTSMLDPQGRNELIKSLQELNLKHQITIIIISHAMEELAVAKRLLVLHQGRVHLDSLPWEVFTAQEFELIGLSPPPMAKLTQSLRERDFKIDKTIITLEQMVNFLCR